MNKNMFRKIMLGLACVVGCGLVYAPPKKAAADSRLVAKKVRKIPLSQEDANLIASASRSVKTAFASFLLPTRNDAVEATVLLALRQGLSMAGGVLNQDAEKSTLGFFERVLTEMQLGTIPIFADLNAAVDELGKHCARRLKDRDATGYERERVRLILQHFDATGKIPFKVARAVLECEPVTAICKGPEDPADDASEYSPSRVSETDTEEVGSVGGVHSGGGGCSDATCTCGRQYAQTAEAAREMERVLLPFQATLAEHGYAKDDDGHDIGVVAALVGSAGSMIAYAVRESLAVSKAHAKSKKKAVLECLRELRDVAENFQDGCEAKAIFKTLKTTIATLSGGATESFNEAAQAVVKAELAIILMGAPSRGADVVMLVWRKLVDGIYSMDSLPKEYQEYCEILTLFKDYMTGASAAPNKKKRAKKHRNKRLAASSAPCLEPEVGFSEGNITASPSSSVSVGAVELVPNLVMPFFLDESVDGRSVSAVDVNILSVVPGVKAGLEFGEEAPVVSASAESRLVQRRVVEPSGLLFLLDPKKYDVMCPAEPEEPVTLATLLEGQHPKRFVKHILNLVKTKKCLEFADLGLQEDVEAYIANPGKDAFGSLIAKLCSILRRLDGVKYNDDQPLARDYINALVCAVLDQLVFFESKAHLSVMPKEKRSSLNAHWPYGSRPENELQATVNDKVRGFNVVRVWLEDDSDLGTVLNGISVFKKTR